MSARFLCPLRRVICFAVWRPPLPFLVLLVMHVPIDKLDWSGQADIWTHSSWSHELPEFVWHVAIL